MKAPVFRRLVLAAAVLAALSGTSSLTGAALAKSLPAAKAAPAAENRAVRSFELRTGMADGKMVFVGVGGAIDGVSNPALVVQEGDTVQIRLASGEGAQHDFVSDELGVRSQPFAGKAATILKFKAGKAGTFAYYCSIPGHRQIGMEGKIVVAAAAAAKGAAKAGAAAAAPVVDHTEAHASMHDQKAPGRADDPTKAAPGPLVSVVMDPASVPPPIGARAPKTVRVDLEAVEVDGRLADGVSFNYWTFNGKVPGPMLRVRVGDTVELHLKNAPNSAMMHSVDLHAVTGPGGAAEDLQVAPGEEKVVSWKSLAPGLFVYHCATPMVPHHISAGMYGMILVEPEGGLPKVDREYYVMQGDLYTKGPFGAKGHQAFSVEKMLDERPDYYVFNGAVGAISKELPLKAKVGETVRIYFGVGGPNKPSSFHVIGEIFDKVYNQGSLSHPLADVQTTLVPPGGAAIVELKLDYPGKFMLVDHALARAGKGLMGVMEVDGQKDLAVYRAIETNREVAAAGTK